MQENNAEKAIEALKEYDAEEAVVVRNGEKKKIKAAELVPGDIVEIAVGNKIPADMRVLEVKSITFRIDQKLLTGESDPVNKNPNIVEDADVLQAKKNMLFKGTSCTTGHGIGIVTSIGNKTEIGKIKDSIEEMEQNESPLEKKLNEFGNSLTWVIMVICVVVWLINIGKFNSPEHGSMIKGAIYYFKIAVSLAVAAIPEGLPAVVTTCLALGTVKMAKKNAIVRHLPSVETLGCTTVICSDKTGTLTTSKMSASSVIIPGKVSCDSLELIELEVKGTTYEPIGKILLKSSGKAIDIHSLPQLNDVSLVCTLCNNSQILLDPATRKYDTIGEPTELALKALAEKIHIADAKKGGDSFSDRSKERFETRANLEFARDRKSMSVLFHDQKERRQRLFVKGAPEGIIQRSSHLRQADGSDIEFSEDHKKEFLIALESMSKRALRVLGLAIRENPPSIEDFRLEPENFAQYESHLCFVGLVGMLDPPREEVAGAISVCRDAGIEVIVITGDNKITAEAIGKKIGLFEEGEDLRTKSVTGREWSELNHEQKLKLLETVRLFSRTEPTHKSDIVTLLQEKGNVVAMTGDGVNDAPALKKADIGVGMGSGTDVAKAASDMILADDNFATIVTAVEEGRSIYNNTKQFIRYLISSNIGEVACIFLTAALGIPEALIPVQLLWVNLVTDGLPATALGFNKADQDIMKKSPRNANDKIINLWMFVRYMIIGVYVGIATVGAYAYWYLYCESGPQITFEQLVSHDKCVGEIRPGLPCTLFSQGNVLPSTIALSVLVTIEMFNAMNSLSENQSLLSMPLWTNFWLVGAISLSFALHFAIIYIPFFANVFQVTAIGWEEWKIVLIASFPIILIDEMLKFASRTFGSKGAAHHKKKL